MITSEFWIGFVLGIIVCFMTLGITASVWAARQESPRRSYVIVDGMSCIELNGDFISCNWDEWDNARGNKIKFQHETVENGYVIYDTDGKKIDPWDLVRLLND